eukprot:3239688-Alexandrium_andersonii.AAC.1
MQKQLTMVAEQEKIDLLAAREIRILATAQFIVGQHLLILFGGGAGAKEYAGVGFVLSLRLRLSLIHI